MGPSVLKALTFDVRTLIDIIGVVVGLLIYQRCKQLERIKKKRSEKK